MDHKTENDRLPVIPLLSPHETSVDIFARVMSGLPGEVKVDVGGKGASYTPQGWKAVFPPELVAELKKIANRDSEK